MTALATIQMPRSEAIERVLIGGDVSGLSPRERWDYYCMRCDAAGLDPRAQPFLYVNLSGKLTLYATKAATDQLIANRHISVTIVSKGFDRDTGLYEATARASFPTGQAVEDVGAVWIAEGDKGEKLANAVMKTITKAKRRTVLSACGLGMLDESEIDSIPGAVRVAPDQPILERPPGPAMIHPPNNEPKAEVVSEAKAWVRSAIQMANDKLKNLFLIEGKGDQYKPVVSHANQVVNAMITAWIEDGTLEAKDIAKPNGSRDPAMAGAAFQVGWQQDECELKADVWAFLAHKARDQAEAAGIELREDDMLGLPEALAGTADDTFEEGRE